MLSAGINFERCARLLHEVELQLAESHMFFDAIQTVTALHYKS